MTESEIRADRTPIVPPGEMECHARDMTATMSAEMTLGEVQKRLAEVGQWLPVDGAEARAVGDLVKWNSTGPLRLGYGAWRDLLLGCQFLNGRRELITAGGRTVKNVAGYDLTKFMVGQGGAVGEIVTMTTRTYRRPAGAILVRVEKGAGLVNQLMPTDLRPQWMAATREGMICGYLGDERTLGFYRGAVAELGEVLERSVEEDVAHRAAIWKWGGVEGAFRASVPPVRVMDFVKGIGANPWGADAAFGVVVGEVVDREALFEAARRVGGTVWVVGENPVMSVEMTKVYERVLGAFR